MTDNKVYVKMSPDLETQIAELMNKFNRIEERKGLNQKEREFMQRHIKWSVDRIGELNECVKTLQDGFKTLGELVIEIQKTQTQLDSRLFAIEHSK